MAPTTAPSLMMNSTMIDEQPYAFCGSCHCIVSGNDETCPTGEDQVPQMEFSDELVGFLQSLELTNPYELSCNPYEDEACDTFPPQSNLTALGDAAACGIVYEMEGLSDDQCPTRYSLESYPSVAELEAEGSVLTHHGACGVCSSTQDLAVYIEYPDLVTKGTECSLRGILDFDDGVACYQEVGYTEVSDGKSRVGHVNHNQNTNYMLTSVHSVSRLVMSKRKPCAAMWVYNGFNTRDNCLDTCIQFTLSGTPNNGPAPECAIADCLLCDEIESGPLFQKVAARSRRRSGLLSKIARPCDGILLVNHTVPCNFSLSTDMPVPETQSPSTVAPVVPGTTSDSNSLKLSFAQVLIIELLLHWIAGHHGFKG